MTLGNSNSTRKNHISSAKHQIRAKCLKTSFGIAELGSDHAELELGSDHGERLAIED